MISLLIASDVRLYSEGIREFLNKSGAFRITESVSRSDDAVRAILVSPPMVVLLDQAMSGSLDVLRAIRPRHPDIGIIALGVPEEEQRLLEWAEGGVTGFVPREASGAELIATIESAVRGELVCSPRFAGTLLRQLALRAASEAGPRETPLTSRESEIARLIDLNLSNKQIAARLGIEVATVKNHVHNLLEKLQVHRRAEAAARLRRREPRETTPHSGQQSVRE